MCLLKLFVFLFEHCFHCCFLILVKPSAASSSNQLAITASNSQDVGAKRLRCDEQAELNNEIEDLDARIQNKNQPVLMAVYHDAVSLNEMLAIVVTLPSGVKDVVFALLGTGPETNLVEIGYTWPGVVYNVDALFASALAAETITLTSPKIVALKAELENHRDHINSKPRGSIQLTLPISVKTDPDSIKYKLAKGKNGEIVLMADLCTLQRAYTAIKPEFDCHFKEF